MTGLSDRVTRAASAAANAWDRFFFERVPASNATVLRIAYGIVLTGWALSIAPDALAFFGDRGVLPAHPRRDWRWSLLDAFPSDGAVIALVAVLVIAGVCLIVGVMPRIATFAALVVLISLLYRNFWVTNSGDLLLRNLAFLLLFVPTGAALTLPQFLRDRERAFRFPDHPIWPLRLIQIQVSVGYLFSVWEKLPGDTWRDGTAISYALRIEDIVRFQAPGLLTDQVVLVNAITYGTLGLELALAILVWNRKLRPWVLAGGVLMHLGIDVFLEVGFFSYLMIVAYIAFIPSDRLDAWVQSVRSRQRASRGRAVSV